MLRGIESVTKGMIGVMDLNDTIANNLANINSTGFKQTKLIFKNIQDTAINNIGEKYSNDGSKSIGSISIGSKVDAAIIDFKQGGLRTTGNPLDLAINGDGFFRIKTSDGSEAYTRNGSFIIDQNGMISTVNGETVIGKDDAGRDSSIVLNIDKKQVKNIVIESDGTIRLDKERIGQIEIVDFKDKSNLVPLGNSLYKPSDVKNNKPIQAQRFELSQGSIENSNANVLESMVNSINAMRTYETLNSIIKKTSETLEKSINTVGRVR